MNKRPNSAKRINITEPTLPAFNAIAPQVKEILSSRMVTNAKYVNIFERKLRDYLGVKHVIALSSCTSGLLLLFKALKLQGEVILPSFTFSATGHAVLWNNLKPVFVDIDLQTYNLDCKKIESAITKRTCAILAVHVFGNPAHGEFLQHIAKKYKIKLFFDAAHGFGAERLGTRLGGFGDAEVFSLSPTKLLTSVEGGIVATNSDEIAYQIKIGRSYADPGNYDTQFEGLSARLGEFNAIIGLESLKMLDRNVVKRNKIASLYIKRLGKLPGISFQKIEKGNVSSYKDFSILIDKNKFGLHRNELASLLEKEHIAIRKYFYPPLHRQKAFSRYFNEFDKQLPNTNYLAQNSLSLPLFSHMNIKDAERICRLIEFFGNQR